jgi:coiled-coil domain-containing protein 63/114
MKTLENKLEKQRQKYNQAVAHNRELRDQIDVLRRERVVFDKIYQNLVKKRTILKTASYFPFDIIFKF